MSSTLVETVSINYEDFNDSFLTCGTCLCLYDAIDHTPKILPCSHSVCRSCLERIVEATSRDNATFRCPICRETIRIPTGGCGSFPPSFIINQLLDLMAQQRRDIIPKCSMHPTQELMFCESCDTVFCVDCACGSHNSGGSTAHTVIPFSIAIKRMSEILLYKASLCMKNLSRAEDAVAKEMENLNQSAELCMHAVSKSFQDLLNLVDNRRHQVLQKVQQIRDEKKRVLLDQMEIIEAEKSRVQEDCDGLQQQIEVRNITKKISDLNEKLDISSTLSEPRENSFIKFENSHNTALDNIQSALADFGRVTISTTYPALCTAKLPPSVTHIRCDVTVTTVDYHGLLRTTGGDPLSATFRDNKGDFMEVAVEDNNNGSYTISFTAENIGKHILDIRIFDRPIRDSPFHVDVTCHNNPLSKYGESGNGIDEFRQPLNVVLNTNGELCVLDTGNSRIKYLTPSLSFVRHLEGTGLEQRSATGLCISPFSGNLVVCNWRLKTVVELDSDGMCHKKFTSEKFVEPISVAVSKNNEYIIADNGLVKILIFTADGEYVRSIGKKGNKKGEFKLPLSAVCCGKNDSIIVCDSARLQSFNMKGELLQEYKCEGGGGGQFGGVTLDRFGNILATRCERGRCSVQIFNADGKWVFEVDSDGDRLKRAAGLVALDNGHVVVVDLGHDCLKKFRYM